jgi:hypothetical protein
LLLSREINYSAWNSGGAVGHFLQSRAKINPLYIPHYVPQHIMEAGDSSRWFPRKTQNARVNKAKCIDGRHRRGCRGLRYRNNLDNPMVWKPSPRVNVIEWHESSAIVIAAIGSIFMRVHFAYRNCINGSVERDREIALNERTSRLGVVVYRRARPRQSD